MTEKEAMREAMLADLNIIYRAIDPNSAYMNDVRTPAVEAFHRLANRVHTLTAATHVPQEPWCATCSTNFDKTTDPCRNCSFMESTDHPPSDWFNEHLTARHLLAVPQVTVMKMLSSGHGCHDCGHGNPVLCGWLCAPSDGLSAWIDASAIASQPTVPTSEAVREALERLRQAAEGLRGWERIDGTEAMDEEYHTRVAQLDAEALATLTAATHVPQEVVEAWDEVMRSPLDYIESDSERRPEPPVLRCRYCHAEYGNGSYKLTACEAARAWAPLVQHKEDCPFAAIDRFIRGEATDAE